MDVPSPCFFKITVNSVLHIECSHTTLQGSTRSYYSGLKYVEKIPHKAIDISDLPHDWCVLKCESGVKLFRKCEIQVNDFTVMEEVNIDDNGRITLKIGRNEIDPSDIGFPNNFYQTIIPLSQLLQIIGTATICLGKQVPHDFSNITVTLGNGSKFYGKKSKYCLGYAPLTSRGRICPKCQSVNISKFVKHNLTDDNEAALADSDEEQHEQHVISEETLCQYFPNCPDLLAQILRFQSKCLWDGKNGKDGRCHRWPKDIISFAISLFITSPRPYRLISSVLYLPSESLVKKYKNNLEKDPGINHNFIQWMYTEMERTDSPKTGGLIFDEMTIQSGVQLQPEGEGLSMTGFVDLGCDNSGLTTVTDKAKPMEVANTVLQFIFLGLNGFRFPFSYMLCKTLSTGQLMTIITDIIQTLESYDISIIFLCMDGASVNRSLCNSMTSCMSAVTQNVVSVHDKLCCIMDFSHVVKKLRNSIYSSGQEEGSKRLIIHPMGYVEWSHFYDAYIWDKNNHTLRIHRKLNDEHFYLNNALKMRNHLAEQVLNSDMLFLMEQYSKS